MTEGRLAPEEVRTRTFSRVLRGYRRREVRRLLERAATDLARLRDGLAAAGPHDQPPLTPEEVEEARFQPSLGGYEMEEVDDFLDQLMVELDLAAREPLRPPSALPAPPAETPAPVDTRERPVPGDPSGPVDTGERPVPGDAQGPVDAWGRLVAGSATLPLRGAEPGAGSLEAAPEPVGAAPPAAAPGTEPALTPAEVETRSFDRGVPGYLPGHVDLFLARAARALAGRDGEALTRWDVLRQRFPLGPWGYATGEVDAFLVRLAAQFPDPDPATREEILRRVEGG